VARGSSRLNHLQKRCNLLQGSKIECKTALVQPAASGLARREFEGEISTMVVTSHGNVMTNQWQAHPLFRQRVPSHTRGG
jgi:hypothetical protein